jgi:hypothetical protein
MIFGERLSASHIELEVVKSQAGSRVMEVGDSVRVFIINRFPLVLRDDRR